MEKEIKKDSPVKNVISIFNEPKKFIIPTFIISILALVFSFATFTMQISHRGPRDIKGKYVQDFENHGKQFSKNDKFNYDDYNDKRNGKSDKSDKNDKNGNENNNGKNWNRNENSDNFESNRYNEPFNFKNGPDREKNFGDNKSNDFFKNGQLPPSEKPSLKDNNSNS